MALAQEELCFTDLDAPGLGRRRAGRGFSFIDTGGGAVREPERLARLRALVIPPAWTGVWICPRAEGHIQAVGYDARGRRQYLYHPDYRAAREEAKFEHILAFAKVLPRLRRQIARDLAGPLHSRARVMAGVVSLLETSLIRVGSEAYAKDNGSFGLTTLRQRHVKVEGEALRFHFTGKSGRVWRLTLRDRRVAGVVRRCQELPGQQLFQYLDHAGERQSITSADINAYLKEASGAPITAKDFRTWAGTVLAGVMLAETETPTSLSAARRSLTKVVGKVAARLGNTVAVCRRSYIHPELVRAHLDGGLVLDRGAGGRAGLKAEEAAVLAFLLGRLGEGSDPS